VRRQTRDDDCGPTAIANAFEFHHRRVGLRGLREAVGTLDNEGSDEHDILRALLIYGCDVDEHKGDTARESWLWILDSLRAGRPVLLCVDRWEHWCTVIGVSAAQVVLYDPARETGGTFVLRFRDLRARWEAARRVRERGPRFYGIGVGAPPT
jgi:ABC-type bacteriocin/lantibiotic exporter with double-glycine peptidase domain